MTTSLPRERGGSPFSAARASSRAVLQLAWASFEPSERRDAGQGRERAQGGSSRAALAEKSGGRCVSTHIRRAETAGRHRRDASGAPAPRRDRLHPITQTQRDIVDAFVAQGFSVIEGPEVELDYYNFEALRIPKDHPARELMDTFYIDRERRGPTTSCSCARTPRPTRSGSWRAHEPPIRIICPGAHVPKRGDGPDARVDDHADRGARG